MVCLLTLLAYTPSLETMDRDFQSRLVGDVGGGLWWSSSELLLLAGRFAGCWLGGKTLTGSGENRSLIKFMQEQSTSLLLKQSLLHSARAAGSFSIR